jgi:hypothetical protein
MTRRAFFAIVLTSVMLAACSGIAVPADKARYVGQWKGLGMDLTITPDGGVDYKRVSGSGSASVTAPLQSFDGDDFIVGIWMFTTRFKVNKPPYQDDGMWKMIVEGVELTRIRGPNSAPKQEQKA